MKKTIKGEEEILYKNTALDDEASIYQQREQETEKQKLSKMNKKQKLKYFRDYYLFKTLLCLVGIFVVAFTIWHFTKPKMENVFYVAVVDETLNPDEKQQLQNELQNRYNADGKYKKVLIDDTFYTRDDGITRMEVYLRNKEIDVVIADKEVFKTLAAYGFMQDLNTVFDNDFKSEYSNDLFYTPGYKDTDEITLEDKEVGKGEELAYGLDITSSSRFSKMKNLIKDPVIGIVVDAPNMDNAKDFINNVLMEEH